MGEPWGNHGGTMGNQCYVRALKSGPFPTVHLRQAVGSLDTRRCDGPSASEL